jgi:hypothetical protein
MNDELWKSHSAVVAFDHYPALVATSAEQAGEVGALHHFNFLIDRSIRRLTTD